MFSGLSSRNSSGNSDGGQSWYATGLSQRLIAVAPTDV
jgi:hypothetical protein